MTIAAGFKAAGGVLLCADTLHQTPSSKSHDSKIVRYELEGCVLVFAIAGHTPFATMAAQECRDKVIECPKKTFSEVLRAIREAVKTINETTWIAGQAMRLSIPDSSS
jgi:hypothetical protein